MTSSISLSDLDYRVLPSLCRYSEIVPLALQSKSMKKKYLPINSGEFMKNNANMIARINISDGRGFIDPFLSTLSFKLKNLSGADISVDGSYSSLIQSIRITANGNDLEFIRNYGHLHNVLSNLKLSPAKRVSRNEGFGTNGCGYTPETCAIAQAGAPPAGAFVPGGAQTNHVRVDGNNYGNGETIIPNNGVVNVQLGLLSSILGTNAEKYIPLFLIGMLTLEIEF